MFIRLFSGFDVLRMAAQPPKVKLAPGHKMPVAHLNPPRFEILAGDKGAAGKRVKSRFRYRRRNKLTYTHLNDPAHTQDKLALGPGTEVSKGNTRASPL